MHQKLDGVAIAAMLLLCLSWGVQQAAIKLAVPGIPPALQAGLRSAGAGLLVFLWCWWRQIPLFHRDGTLWAGIAAGLLFGVEFLLIYWGLHFTDVARSVVLLYTAPFVVALGGHWLIPGERLRPIQGMGLVLAFGGVAYAFGERLTGGMVGDLAWLGDLMAAGGAVLWGATTLLIKKTRLRQAPPAKTLLYQLAVSALLLIVASPLLGEQAASPLTPTILLAFAYQTLWAVPVTFLIWFWLLAHYPAGRLSAFTFLTPVFGIAAGWLLLGEAVSPRLIVAVIGIAAGLWLVNRPAAAAVQR